MKLRKLLAMFIIIIALVLLGETKSQASLHLKNLDFQVQINDDGSMNVVETWDIKVSDTNTLYKTFIKDDTKYSSIMDVSVKDITKGENNIFNSASKWEYHLPKGYFFAGTNNKGENEIAWGVSIESTTRKQYLISYRVNDVITKYNDCAELYWQFLGNEFEISANKITGTIKLPAKVQHLEDLKVWGHTKYLNGEVKVVSSDTVEFNLNNYKSKNYVEVRLAMPTYLFEKVSSENISQEEKLDDIIKEETEWANEANARRDRRNKNFKLLILATILVNTSIGIMFSKKIKKNKQFLEKNPNILPEQQLEYYRELPDKEETPLEAVFILKTGYKQSCLPNVFSATILNFALKGYIRIEQEGKTIKILLNKIKTDELTGDEKKVLEILRAASNNNELTMAELEKYIKNYPSKLMNLNSTFEKVSKTQASEKGKFDTNRFNKQIVYAEKNVGYIFILIIIIIASIFTIGYAYKNVQGMLITCTIISLAFFIVVTIINLILNMKITTSFNGFTQKGINEQEQWKAFKKYMEDFSYLDEKEVPELVLWEKYLVYATAFGIADKVLKQLKVKYPELNNQDTISNMVLFNAMYNANGLNANFINSISTSTSRMYSSTYSSGSGSGGGFSGGGGFGGRWRWPEAEDNKIYLKKASLSNSPFCTTRIKNIFPKTT
jgi:uncharacterized membrane protein